MIKKNKYKFLFFLLLIIPAFSCQLLDEVFLESPDVGSVAPGSASDTADSGSQNNPNIIPTSTLAETLTPSPTAVVDSTDPTATPSPVPTKTIEQNETPLDHQVIDELTLPEGLENFSSYESNTGYGFYHPKGWIVAEYFGQTIVTNDPKVLQEGGALADRPLIIFLAGSVLDLAVSEKERLELLQLEILSSIAPGTTPTELEFIEPYSQFGAAGVRGEYALQTDSESYRVISVSLNRSVMYAIGLAVVAESQLPKYETTAKDILNSLQLLSDTHNADSATYGLTPKELAQLEQDIQALVSVPNSTQPIGFGQTLTANTFSGPIAFEFSADSEIISFTVTPSDQLMDPIVDVVDSNGNSILPNGLIDFTLAGQPEIAEVQLSKGGVYRIFVRGFGFSAGEFTITLDQP